MNEVKSYPHLMIECTAQKMKFFIKDFFSNRNQETVVLVTFTEEILNAKLHFLCNDGCSN